MVRDSPNRNAGSPRLPAPGVGTAAVVGFVAAGAQLAALLLGHGSESVPATGASSGIDGRWIVLSAPDWSSPPVLAASTFQERLAGVRGLPAGRGLLLWTRAVHGWGLKRPVRVVRLDADGTVGEFRWLEPRRFITWPEPGWTLELPSWQPWPQEGTKLTAAATVQHT